MMLLLQGGGMGNRVDFCGLKKRGNVKFSRNSNYFQGCWLVYVVGWVCWLVYGFVCLGTFKKKGFVPINKLQINLHICIVLFEFSAALYS